MHTYAYFSFGLFETENGAKLTFCHYVSYYILRAFWIMLADAGNPETHLDADVDPALQTLSVLYKIKCLGFQLRF